MKTILFAVFLFLLPGLSALGTDRTGRTAPLSGSGAGGSRIAWDYSSMREIAPVGDYPRMCRISDESVAVVYENGYGSTVIRYSGDEGRSWSRPDTLFRGFTARNGRDSAFVWVSNPELIRLADGVLLAACNYRPQKPGIYPFGIVVRRSTDAGVTWSPPQTIYRAGRSFGDGCWEPSFLQLPDGDVHVYFSNEGVFTKSDEQDIEVLVSHDGGVSWEPETRQVCFRAGKRDGMPVACLAGDEIVVSVEDNRIGEFKPSVVRNPVDGCWQSPVLADSPLREPALREPLHDTVYAGAPYIITLPTGETALSYQTTRGRTKEWELSTMEVAVGDRRGRNFTNVTRPFDIPADRLAKWNSIMVFDQERIAALSGCNYNGGRVGVWMILGYIVPELISLTPSDIRADGNVSDAEWGGRLPVFIGHRGPSNLRAGVCRDGRDLCFAARVSESVSGKCRVNFYLSAGEETYKVETFRDGAAAVFRQNGAVWTRLSGSRIENGYSDLPDGYGIEVKVPLGLLGIGRGTPLRINCGLVAPDSAGDCYEEPVANTAEDDPATWCRVGGW